MAVEKGVDKPNEHVRNYYSARGFPLLYNRVPCDKPVLTLENYTKWYEMWLVMPDGTTTEVPVEVLIDTMNLYDDALWIDHCFSVRLVYRVAQQMDYFVDERALEVALGRWIQEGHYNPTSVACMEPNDGPEICEV